MHDRRQRVEKGQRVFAGQRENGGGERGRGEGAGGDDDAVPVGRRLENFVAANVDERLGFERDAGIDEAVRFFIEDDLAMQKALVG